VTLDPGSFARTTYATRVEWMDTDAAGYQHNTAVTRYVEGAEAQLMRELGIDGYFGWVPRVHYEVDFEERLWFQQDVTVTIAVEKVGTSSLTLGFEVWAEEFKGKPRRRAATGRYVVVYLPDGATRGKPWPQAWVAALTGQRLM
jgi:acyl-CoA thioester hydrolase